MSFELLIELLVPLLMFIGTDLSIDGSTYHNYPRIRFALKSGVVACILLATIKTIVLGAASLSLFFISFFNFYGLFLFTTLVITDLILALPVLNHYYDYCAYIIFVTTSYYQCFCAFIAVRTLYNTFNDIAGENDYEKFIRIICSNITALLFVFVGDLMHPHMISLLTSAQIYALAPYFIPIGIFLIVEICIDPFLNVRRRALLMSPYKDEVLKNLGEAFSDKRNANTGSIEITSHLNVIYDDVYEENITEPHVIRHNVEELTLTGVLFRDDTRKYTIHSYNDAVFNSEFLKVPYTDNKYMIYDNLLDFGFYSGESEIIKTTYHLNNIDYINEWWSRSDSDKLGNFPHLNIDLLDSYYWIPEGEIINLTNEIRQLSI